MSRSKVDYLIEMYSKEPKCKELISAISSAVLSSSIVYEMEEDAVLGVIVTLVKADLAGKKDIRERYTDMNNRINELFGFDWSMLTGGSDE